MPATQKRTITCKLKRGEGSLFEGPEIIELHCLGVNAGSEDQSIWVKSCHWAPRQLHQTLQQQIEVQNMELLLS